MIPGLGSVNGRLAVLSSPRDAGTNERFYVLEAETDADAELNAYLGANSV